MYHAYICLCICNVCVRHCVLKYIIQKSTINIFIFKCLYNVIITEDTLCALRI